MDIYKFKHQRLSESLLISKFAQKCKHDTIRIKCNRRSITLELRRW